MVDVTSYLKPDRDTWTSKADGYAIVRARAGDACELRGPECIADRDRHREIDHVWGRRTVDPHHPSKLLQLCGYGNFGPGCHPWVSGTREGRELSRVRVAVIAAREGYREVGS